MTKPRQTLRVRLPPYSPPRNDWRRKIHAELFKATAKREVTYCSDDLLELRVSLYFPLQAIGWHYVDNRLKDIMDALQGWAGGSKAQRQLEAIIPNDNQARKVTVEKLIAPKQSHGRGHLVISKYKLGIERQCVI